MKITFTDWPTTLNEFVDLHFYDLRKPENTAALFLIALDLFVKDEAVGIEAINLLKGPISLNPHNISFLKDRLLDKPYLPKAYFENATVENDYTPTKPYTIIFYPDERPFDLEDDYIRLYTKTSGADAKRSITLRKKADLYYIWEYPGILMDIRKPQALDPWA